jgi:hypothetical protein
MKTKRVAVAVGKTILLLGCLYFFICSLDLLSKSFKLIGGITLKEKLPRELITLCRIIILVI